MDIFLRNFNHQEKYIFAFPRMARICLLTIGTLMPCSAAYAVWLFPSMRHSVKIERWLSVTAEVDTDGVIRPLLIRWHDGRQWEVTKVLHTCTASHDEFEGVRYTVKIGRAVRYLYREGQRWYVDRSP